MPFENLLVETRERIARVTLNRPHKLNALNRATIGELGACC
jgi:enoyl-CoA hydratase